MNPTTSTTSTTSTTETTETTETTGGPVPWRPGRARRIGAAVALLLVLAFSVAAVASMPDSGTSAGVSPGASTQHRSGG